MKIAAIDDHPVVLMGLEKIFSRAEQVTSYRLFEDSDQFLEEIASNTYDLLIIDWNLPNIDSFTLLKKIKKIACNARVIVFSVISEKMIAKRLLVDGTVHGYICKNEPQRVINNAMMSVINGRYYFSDLKPFFEDENQAAGLPGGLDELSSREHQILQLILDGKSLKDIADEIFLHPSTIGTYKSRIFEKLNVQNTKELVQYAMENGVIR